MDAGGIVVAAVAGGGAAALGAALRRARPVRWRGVVATGVVAGAVFAPLLARVAVGGAIGHAADPVGNGVDLATLVGMGGAGALAGLVTAGWRGRRPRS
ncbi:MAG: hypothetical protein JSR18_09320 [Proteobacteria bacterium]|nr:hypothetical protein [Pseudomonadota bacterium]